MPDDNKKYYEALLWNQNKIQQLGDIQITTFNAASYSPSPEILVRKRISLSRLPPKETASSSEKGRKRYKTWEVSSTSLGAKDSTLKDKDLTVKAKAKNLTVKAKVKDLTVKAKAKDLTAKVKAKDLTAKDKDCTVKAKDWALSR